MNQQAFDNIYKIIIVIILLFFIVRFYHITTQVDERLNRLNYINQEHKSIPTNYYPLI